MKTISIPKISLAGKSSSGSAPAKIKLPDGTKFTNSTCSNFDWLKNVDTSEMTDMDAMFSHCQKLASLDLSSFDTSAVTNMTDMFNYCYILTSLDLSSFDTSLVTSMGGMFNKCEALTSLLLGPNFFKTKSVTSIDFSPCTAWVGDTVVTSLVTNSYDRAAAGLGTLTLKLSTRTKAALTDEQKAAITAKGYTIA